MIKKSLVIFIILITISQSVFALNIEEMSDKLVEKLNLNRELTADMIKHYKDWRYIDNSYKVSVATALREGILIPNNKIISPKSEDISTIIKGLTYYGIKNPNYKIVSSFYNFQSINGAIVDADTMVIKGNELVNVGVLTDTRLYNAIMDKNNKAIIVWEQNIIKVPTLLRGKMFFKEGDKLILTSLEKSTFDRWDNIADQKYIEVELGYDINVTQNKRIIYNDELNSNFLDGLVYILGDFTNNTVKPLYIEVP